MIDELHSGSVQQGGSESRPIPLISITGLLKEAFRSALSQKVSSITILIIAGAMCITTLLTVGQSAAAETRIEKQLQSAGSRQLTITDTAKMQVISALTVQVLANSTGIERVLGLATPQDASMVSMAGSGPKVPAWEVRGQLSAGVSLVRGRWPRVGEAIISRSSQARLGLDQPLGSFETTDGARFPIVGSFVARAPFDDFEAGAVIAADATQPLTSLHVVIGAFSDPSAVEQLALSILAAPDPTGLAVRSPASLADLQNKIGGELGQYGRGLLLLVLGAGAALTAMVVLADVLLHRKDIGRRRALGAPRWIITALLLVRAVVPASVGSAAGAMVAGLILSRSGSAPPVLFFLAVVALTIFAAGGATVVPAVIAAFQDPVRVLRTA